MSFTTNLLLIIGLLAYYYFVLRKYNSLGFRMFSLFGFVAIAAVYWWYDGYQELQALRKTGIVVEATVTKKNVDYSSSSSVPDNVVGVKFTTPQGKTVELEAREMTSKEEYAEVEVGQKALVVYDAGIQTAYLKTTLERSNKDYNYILILPGVLFLLGTLCLIFLSKLKVHAHEGTVYEYVTDESGKVVLDDLSSPTNQAIKKANLISKMVQIFR